MTSLKKFSLILLALALAVSIWGCASSADPQTTTLPPDTTAPQVTVDYEEVTDPSIDVTIGAEPFVPLPGITSGTDAQTAQLRIHTTGSGWQNAFKQETGCFALVSDVQELNSLVESKLSAFELDLSAYDEAFFAENRLVLIPRSSNSGSVTYQAKLNVDGDMIHIELDAQMPEIGTADMAEWLVLVVLPDAQYENMTVTVPEAGGNPGTVTK